jgi:hypothetical protein
MIELRDEHIPGGTPLLAAPQCPGWTRRTFLCSQMPGRVARCDGPFYFGPLELGELQSRSLSVEEVF